MVSLLSVGVSEIKSIKESYLKQGTSYQIIAKVMLLTLNSKNFCVKPKVSLEDKVYPKTYCHNSQDDIQVDESPTRIHVQNLLIIGWTLIKEQLVKLKLGT
jgi:hypothetical protein